MTDMLHEGPESTSVETPSSGVDTPQTVEAGLLAEENEYNQLPENMSRLETVVNLAVARIETLETQVAFLSNRIDADPPQPGGFLSYASESDVPPRVTPGKSRFPFANVVEGTETDCPNCRHHFTLGHSRMGCPNENCELHRP